MVSPTTRAMKNGEAQDAARHSDAAPYRVLVVKGGGAIRRPALSRSLRGRRAHAWVTMAPTNTAHKEACR